jgi:hypothetical protein
MYDLLFLTQYPQFSKIKMLMLIRLLATTLSTLRLKLSYSILAFAIFQLSHTNFVLQGAKKTLFFTSNVEILQCMWSTFLKKTPHLISIVQPTVEPQK